MRVVLSASNKPCSAETSVFNFSAEPPNTSVVNVDKLAPGAIPTYCQGTGLIKFVLTGLGSKDKKVVWSAADAAGTMLPSTVFEYGGVTTNTRKDSIYLRRTFNMQGTYIVSATVSSGACAAEVSTATFVVGPKPIATVLSVLPTNTLRCQGDAPSVFELSATASSGASLEWFKVVNNGVKSTTSFNTIVGPTVSYTFPPNEVGKTELYVLARNPNCPKDTTNTLVQTIITKAKPVIAPLANPSTVCPGDVVTLYANATVNTGSVYNYNWVATPVAYIAQSPTSAQATSNPLVSTVYKLTVSEYDGTLTCVSSASVPVTVFVKPLITSPVAVPTICNNASIVIKGNLGGNLANGIWESAGNGQFYVGAAINNVVTVNQPTIKYVPSKTERDAGFAYIKLKATGLNCPLETDPFKIIIAPRPNLNVTSINVGFAAVDSFNAKVKINQDEKVNLVAKFKNDPPATNNAHWEIVSGSGSFSDIDTKSGVQTVYAPSDADYQLGTVQLKVTISGCETITYFINVEVTPITKTTLLTPNGDGKNDEFVIEGLPADASLTVFDRWGRKVHEELNYNGKWNANDVPSGTYYWVIKYRLGDKSGYVEVVK